MKRPYFFSSANGYAALGKFFNIRKCDFIHSCFGASNNR